MRDPHELLGVSRAASEEEIKRAFRSKAKLCHPDTHPNNPAIEREFRELVVAYHEALKRRQQKDERQEKSGTSFSSELKKASQDSGEPRKPSRAQSFTPDRDLEDKVDVLRKARRRREKRAQKVGGTAHATTPEKSPVNSVFKSFFQKKILSPFEDMVKQNLDAPVHKPKAKNVEQTQKTGKDHQYKLDIGFMEARTGGKVPLKLKNGRNIHVKIAPETREGQTLRVQGLGEMGNKQQAAGDALVTISIVGDAYGERSNNDFFLRLPVTIIEAALGADIFVPGLYQDSRVKIPPNSNSGTNLRIKGKGFKNPKGGAPGDQYITLEVKLPNYPDKRLNAFLSSWSQDYDYDVRRHIGMGSIETTKKEGSS